MAEINAPNAKVSLRLKLTNHPIRENIYTINEVKNIAISVPINPYVMIVPIFLKKIFFSRL